jgi:hypothetical protein
MKKLSPIHGLLIASMGLFPLFSASQNMVYNGSFEIYNQCPQQLNSFCGNNDLPDWVCIETPDYYNICASIPSWVNVPYAKLGYQQPRTGNAFAGIVCAQGTNSNAREFMQTQLSSTLIPGARYCVKFYLNFADTSAYAASQIGAYFSDTAIMPVVYNPGYTLVYFPSQIKETQFITDTIGWTEVSGIYTAAGTENFITIGKFDLDSSVNVQPYDTASQMPLAYYYIDDVSVEEIKDANAGRDTTICVGDSLTIGSNLTLDAAYNWSPSAGLSNSIVANPKAAPSVTTTYVLTKNQCGIVSSDTITIVVKSACDPLPLNVPTLLTPGQYFQITGMDQSIDLEVYNTIGQIVCRRTNYNNDLLSDLLSAGMYIYRISKADGEMLKGKFCVIK